MANAVTYTPGRECRVKIAGCFQWLDAVVAQSSPLRVQISHLHPVWHGATVCPLRIVVAKRLPMGVSAANEARTAKAARLRARQGATA